MFVASPQHNTCFQNCIESPTSNDSTSG